MMQLWRSHDLPMNTITLPLQDYLQKLTARPEVSKFCRQRTLCHTIAGNPVPVLTIAAPSSSVSEAKVRGEGVVGGAGLLGAVRMYTYTVCVCVCVCGWVKVVLTIVWGWWKY